MFTTSLKERELGEALGRVHFTGVKQKSVAYILAEVKRLLSMAYCNMQIGLHEVTEILKAEKLQNPHIAKKIKKMIDDIFTASKRAKHRLDYFLHVWKQLIETMISVVGDPKKAISEAAPILTAHAEESGKKMARMMFKEFQSIATVVNAVSIKMAKLLPIKDESPGLARCGVSC